MEEAGGPLGVILCVAGIHKNAMRVLPEFIQHHVNVGVPQIVLGIANQDDLSYFKRQLQHFVDRGVVVLGVHGTIAEPTGGNNNYTRIIDDYEILKLQFYNTCLYHAKGMTEYLAIWDVDELWMPPMDEYYQKYGRRKQTLANQTTSTTTAMTTNTMENNNNDNQHPHHNDLLWRSSPYRHVMSLPEAVRSMRGLSGCVDWCYQTFPSYNILRAITQKHANAMRNNNHTPPEALGGYYGFPSREIWLRYTRQKPIIRTQYAHHASYHNAGSCRRPSVPQRGWADGFEVLPGGNDDGHNKNRYSVDFQDCPFYPEPNNALGAMHHYMDLFRHELEMRCTPRWTSIRNTCDPPL